MKVKQLIHNGFVALNLKNNPDQDYINETEFIEFIVYNHKKLFKDEVIGYYCISMDDLRREFIKQKGTLQSKQIFL